MKKIFKFALLGAMTFTVGASAASVKELEKRIKELESLDQRVEDLEYSSYEDIFRFSGMLEMRYDALSSEEKKSNTEAYDQSYRMWADIDMEAKFSDKLSFYGRLSMAKRLNQTSKSVGANFESLEEGQDESYSNSDVFFQRAFVNYMFNKNFTFTFGRLPTANGTPYHLTRDESVDGAYSNLTYNAFLDGAALTYSFLDNFKLKFVHTPFQFAADDRSLTPGFSTNERTDGGNFGGPNKSFAFLLEYGKENLSWARKVFTSFSYFSGEIPFYAENIDNTGNANGLSNIEIIIKRSVFNLDVNDILKSNFDFNLQVMHLNGNSNGFLRAGGVNNYFLTSDGGKFSATAGIFTGRYAINSNNKIGFQYSKGSKNAFSSDLVGKDGISMSVAGTAYHIFYNHTFGGGLKVNIGYQANQEDYRSPLNGVLGKKAQVDNVNESVYTSFVANF